MAKGLPKVVSEKEFRSAVEKFRVKEKKNSRERDKLSAQRRRLPMMEMKENFVFEGPGGKKTFLDLFEGRRQLIVYHFMYHPKTDTFCKGCSFVADHIPHLAHLHARNTSFAMISHAPLKSMQRHKKRLGWTQPWYSDLNNDFNQTLGIDGDHHHELSVFIRDGKKIFRTYYTTGRGVEYLGTPWAFLDVTPWGRQETWEDSPKGWPQGPLYLWWQFHDEYKSPAKSK
jgi:predicted dithiol-disulfide oxidoreductase (DUF899 family)